MAAKRDLMKENSRRSAPNPNGLVKFSEKQSEQVSSQDSAMNKGNGDKDPESSLTYDQKVVDECPAVETPQAWVECVNCKKWRSISDQLAEIYNAPGYKWTCKDNKQKAFANCYVPQEKTNEKIDKELGISGGEVACPARSKFGVSEDSEQPDSKNDCWTEIKCNFFLRPNRKTQTYDEVCFCMPPLDGNLGCGEECLNRITKVECTRDTCPCGDLCSNQQFQNGKYAKFDRSHCGKKGQGLKLQENVSEGQFLIEYVGEVLDRAAYKARQKLYASMGKKHFYFMALDRGQIIDASSHGNLSRYINHSCDPNCRTEKWMVNGKVCIGIFAVRNIKKGEEVTFDYQFVREFGSAAQRCFCGTAKCRGYLGGNLSDAEAIFQGDFSEDPESVTIHGKGGPAQPVIRTIPPAVDSKIVNPADIPLQTGSVSRESEMDMNDSRISDVKVNELIEFPVRLGGTPRLTEPVSDSLLLVKKSKNVKVKLNLAKPCTIIESSTEISVKKAKPAAQTLKSEGAKIPQTSITRHLERVEERLDELVDGHGGLGNQRDRTIASRLQDKWDLHDIRRPEQSSRKDRWIGTQHFSRNWNESSECKYQDQQKYGSSLLLNQNAYSTIGTSIHESETRQVRASDVTSLEHQPTFWSLKDQAAEAEDSGFMKATCAQNADDEFPPGFEPFFKNIHPKILPTSLIVRSPDQRSTVDQNADADSGFMKSTCAQNAVGEFPPGFEPFLKNIHHKIIATGLTVPSPDQRSAKERTLEAYSGYMKFTCAQNAVDEFPPGFEPFLKNIHHKIIPTGLTIPDQRSAKDQAVEEDSSYMKSTCAQNAVDEFPPGFESFFKNIHHKIIPTRLTVPSPDQQSVKDQTIEEDSSYMKSTCAQNVVDEFPPGFEPFLKNIHHKIIPNGLTVPSPDQQSAKDQTVEEDSGYMKSTYAVDEFPPRFVAFFKNIHPKILPTGPFLKNIHPKILPTGPFLKNIHPKIFPTDLTVPSPDQQSAKDKTAEEDSGFEPFLKNIHPKILPTGLTVPSPDQQSAKDQTAEADSGFLEATSDQNVDELPPRFESPLKNILGQISSTGLTIPSVSRKRPAPVETEVWNFPTKRPKGLSFHGSGNRSFQPQGCAYSRFDIGWSSWPQEEGSWQKKPRDDKCPQKEKCRQEKNERRPREEEWRGKENRPPEEPRLEKWLREGERPHEKRRPGEYENLQQMPWKDKFTRKIVRPREKRRLREHENWQREERPWKKKRPMEHDIRWQREQEETLWECEIRREDALWQRYRERNRESSRQDTLRQRERSREDTFRHRERDRRRPREDILWERERARPQEDTLRQRERSREDTLWQRERNRQRPQEDIIRERERERPRKDVRRERYRKKERAREDTRPKKWQEERGHLKRSSLHCTYYTGE